MNASFRIPHTLVVAMLLTLTTHTFAQTQGAATGSVPAASTPSSVKAADRKLTHRVANMLARTRGLNAARILVKARGGQITLSGSVTDSAQIPLAVDAARQVEGVSHVENRIRVSGASL
jgi:hyperosmotically inducible protein